METHDADNCPTCLGSGEGETLCPRCGRPHAVTRVIFRAWRRDGEVIALFPDIPEHDGLCLSYLHVGQHGAADYSALTYGRSGHALPTRPAKPEEWAALAAELQDIGYRLHVIRRWPSRTVGER